MLREVNIGQRFGYWEVIFPKERLIETPYLSKKIREIHVKCTNCNNTEMYFPLSNLNLKAKSNSMCRNCDKTRRKEKSFCGEISLSYFSRLKTGARDRNLEFSIDQKYIWELYQKQLGECALTGLSLDFNSLVRSKENTASLDRIDSTKGYIKGNVQWIHKSVNLIKNRLDQELFLKLCRSIFEYSQVGNKTTRPSLLNEHLSDDDLNKLKEMNNYNK